MSPLDLVFFCSLFLLVSPGSSSPEVFTMPPTIHRVTVLPYLAVSPSLCQLAKVRVCYHLAIESLTFLVGEAATFSRPRRSPPLTTGIYDFSHRLSSDSLPVVDCSPPRLRVNLLSPLSFAKVGNFTSRSKDATPLIKSITHGSKFGLDIGYLPKSLPQLAEGSCVFSAFPMYPVAVKTHVQASTTLYSLEIRAKSLYKGSAFVGQFASHGLHTSSNEAGKLTLLLIVPALVDIQVMKASSGLSAHKLYASFKERACSPTSSLWERSFTPSSSDPERTFPSSSFSSFKEEICGVQPQNLPLLVETILAGLETRCLSNSAKIESILPSHSITATMLFRFDEMHVDLYEILQDFQELKKCFIRIIGFCFYHFLSWITCFNRRVFGLDCNLKV